MDWRREIEGTWDSQGVSLRVGPLQTQNNGQRSGQTTQHHPSVCPSCLPSQSPIADSSLLHPDSKGPETGQVHLSITTAGNPFPGGWGPASPAGIMTDKAVAEADLITLPPVREGRFSTARSPDSCWCLALRKTRSLVALGPDGSPSLEDGHRSPGCERSAARESQELSGEGLFTHSSCSLRCTEQPQTLWYSLWPQTAAPAFHLSE